jgi:hypothetical protein
LPKPLEFDVVWSGTKDRRGECPRLSGYEGGSSLNNGTYDLQLQRGELREIENLLARQSWAGFRWGGRTAKVKEAA